MSHNLAIRILIALTVIAVSLMGTPAFAQGATVVRVDPSALPAQVNDSVNLSIKVDNIANLTAIELHLSFNPNVLEVVQLTNGGFVAADFSAQNTFDNAAGTIDYAVAQMNRAPAQGSGVLLNITFRAKANGSSSVTLRATQAVPSGLLLADSNGMAIQASWVEGSVTVGNGPALTPTPTFTKTNTPTLTDIPTTPDPQSTTNTPTRTNTPTLTNTPTITRTPTKNGHGGDGHGGDGHGGILGTHDVRFGESLYCIGRAYEVSPWAIADTNGIWWPYIIFPYQRLRIPNVPWTPVPAGPVCQRQFTPSAAPTSIPTAIPGVATVTPIPTITPVPGSTCRAVYFVRAGDTLYAIAMRYSVSYAEIARVNHIPNARLIYSGQRLCIP